MREGDASIDFAQRIAGGVWGHLVGDATGVPYEFRGAVPPESVVFGAEGTWGKPAGTWSDDGALMLATIDSLLGAGPGNTPAFDVEDMGRRFVAWMRDGAYTPGSEGRFDIGGTTRRALERIAAGASASTAGETHEQSKANGSLMRILPLALIDQAIPEADLVRRAEAASSITHANRVPMVACALYVLVARRLLAVGPHHGEHDRTRALAEARGTLERLYAGDPDATAALGELVSWPDRQGRGGVCDSFWSAWDAFAGAHSYRATIQRAIAFGNDTDTTACIAGGLAGIFWGIDGIPVEWRDGMRDREQVVGAVDRILAADGWKTSTSRPIRVDFVDLSVLPNAPARAGRLGMTFLPGKQRDGWTGLHWRDVVLDARRLRTHHGVDTFLLLVEDHELRAARVPDLVERLEAEGIEVLRHPVVDMDIPTDLPAYRATLQEVIGRIEAGKTVAVACRGGLGRTGTAVACVLVEEGLEPGAAIALTRASRPGTIERGIQADLVSRWADVVGTTG